LEGIRTAAIYMVLFPLGYLQMELTEKMDHHGWNLLKSWATSYGIHIAAIYMLLFPLGYLQMKSTEEIDHPGQNQDWNQELLPWMEWAYAEDIVTVHFIIINSQYYTM
jgi:hypothetical protein